MRLRRINSLMGLKAAGVFGDLSREITAALLLRGGVRIIDIRWHVGESPSLPCLGKRASRI